MAGFFLHFLHPPPQILEKESETLAGEVQALKTRLSETQINHERASESGVRLESAGAMLKSIVSQWQKSETGKAGRDAQKSLNQVGRSEQSEEPRRPDAATSRRQLYILPDVEVIVRTLADVAADIEPVRKGPEAGEWEQQELHTGTRVSAEDRKGAALEQENEQNDALIEQEPAADFANEIPVAEDHGEIHTEEKETAPIDGDHFFRLGFALQSATHEAIQFVDVGRVLPGGSNESVARIASAVPIGLGLTEFSLPILGDLQEFMRGEDRETVLELVFLDGGFNEIGRMYLPLAAVGREWISSYGGQVGEGGEGSTGWAGELPIAAPRDILGLLLPGSSTAALCESSRAALCDMLSGAWESDADRAAALWQILTQLAGAGDRFSRVLLHLQLREVGPGVGSPLRWPFGWRPVLIGGEHKYMTYGPKLGDGPTLGHPVVSRSRGAGVGALASLGVLWEDVSREGIQAEEGGEVRAGGEWIDKRPRVDGGQGKDEAGGSPAGKGNINSVEQRGGGTKGATLRLPRTSSPVLDSSTTSPVLPTSSTTSSVFRATSSEASGEEVLENMGGSDVHIANINLAGRDGRAVVAGHSTSSKAVCGRTGFSSSMLPSGEHKDEDPVSAAETEDPVFAEKTKDQTLDRVLDSHPDVVKLGTDSAGPTTSSHTKYDTVEKENEKKVFVVSTTSQKDDEITPDVRNGQPLPSFSSFSEEKQNVKGVSKGSDASEAAETEVPSKRKEQNQESIQGSVTVDSSSSLKVEVKKASPPSPQDAMQECIGWDVLGSASDEKCAGPNATRGFISTIPPTSSSAAAESSFEVATTPTTVTEQIHHKIMPAETFMQSAKHRLIESMVDSVSSVDEQQFLEDPDLQLEGRFVLVSVNEKQPNL